eukprot:389539_1
MSARQLRDAFFRTPCNVTIDKQLYRVVKKLDNGSFGQVYRGHLLHQEDKVVAIKVMSHERIKMTKQSKRIEEEINLHSHINTKNVNWLHENEPGIVKLFTHDHKVKIRKKLYKCIVMEFCEGGHLNSYLRGHPMELLSEIESFYFFQQIMRSLECLHKQHIIHRDIKPQNLLLSYRRGGRPILKLCDFGLAKRLSHSTATTHSMCGTPNYVAPEIVNAEGHSYGADIWSAGIVLYIMLVKHHQPPFETGNIQLTMAKVRDNEVDIPTYLSKECQSFLSQLLIKNKSKRITIYQLKQHIWYRRHKIKLIQYTKDSDEYVGEYHDFGTDMTTSFNVLESNKHQNDIVLFQELKRKLFGELSQQYIDRKSNPSKFPIMLQYIQHNKYLLDDTLDNVKLFAL